jgi:hypothetical protein
LITGFEHTLLSELGSLVHSHQTLIKEVQGLKRALGQKNGEQVPSLELEEPFFPLRTVGEVQKLNERLNGNLLLRRQLVGML